MKIAWLVKADGSTEFPKPKNGKTFSLEELQGFVGGMVELITLPNGKQVWLNEEGKLKSLPVNQRMTIHWQLTYAGYEVGGDDVVVGDVLFCDPEFTRDDDDQ